MATQAFKPRRASNLPLAWIPAVHTFWKTALSVLLDSKYSSVNLEAALKNLFGHSSSIADWSIAQEMGMHIGMPVTTTEDTTTFLITNYNGVGDDDVTTGQCIGTSFAQHN